MCVAPGAILKSPPTILLSTRRFIFFFLYQVYTIYQCECLCIYKNIFVWLDFIKWLVQLYHHYTYFFIFFDFRKTIKLSATCINRINQLINLNNLQSSSKIKHDYIWKEIYIYFDYYMSFVLPLNLKNK